MKLYAAGSNGSGQLAFGHLDDVSTFTPTRFSSSLDSILPHSTIIDLVSSSTHALLLIHYKSDTSVPGRNILVGAGTNTLGQLGPKCQLWSDVKPDTEWKVVNALPRGLGGNDEWEAMKVAATWTTSFVVYRRNPVGGVDREKEMEEMVVSFGSNDFGELGRQAGDDEEEEEDDVGLPAVVELGLGKGDTVEMLRGGQRHVLAVVKGREGQRLIGWGANRKGELEVSTLDRATVGQTEESYLGDTAKGKGKGKGKSNARPPFLPPTTLALPLPPGTRIIDIRLGASHSLALLDTGAILAWGSDAKGQIAGLSSIAGATGIAATWGGNYVLQRTSRDTGLLSQGANTYSQLLRPSTAGQRGPHKVDKPEAREIRTIVAGSEHLLVHLTRPDGGEKLDELWVGGWNEHGNLGLGDQVDRAALTRVDLSGEGARLRIGGIWGGCGSSWVWVLED
ncbi:regulator of chromosome condensation 1/beta-lactamase-inhibitor protein II [Dioszegia hungarica]|uniref:Regulator of chromosome condensation 1/beta-lactamase-inhibitor protein II n=1 Tax=Dioszegia hungarica TaxID=4972 RepID=A0AA38H5E7_9TREE|nr:regulator of chromosome condensation 1/beta-lactamase-inhibitor protein II [Dioszegia hungarica]KAI9633937.1 regulator of chromosome condensation 1/beta-lactamase-inhibitor protein II [Dioszegia hungarica]